MLFSFGGVPILGSQASGDVIGLTQDGLELCRRMMASDVGREDVEAVDPRLPEALARGVFLQGGTDSMVKRKKAAYVHVTQRCNLSCAGCYSLDDKRNRLQDASVGQFETAFGKLVELEVLDVIISGGEPFLRSDLPDLCKAAKRSGIGQITIITNGTLVTEEALARLAPVVDCVSVSFDGTSRNAPAF